MTKRTAQIFLALSLTSAAACITVNIYFPAPEVRAAAEEIVEETWGAKPSKPAPGAMLRTIGKRVFAAVATAASPREAYAAKDADINVSTAAIRALKDAMKERAGKLKPHLGNGHVGIDKSGMLSARDLSGLALRDQADLRRLIDAENRDRRSLYQEIAKANNFEDDRVNDIQTIFAETWREKAEKGWWTQRPDGSWVQR